MSWPREIEVWHAVTTLTRYFHWNSTAFYSVADPRSEFFHPRSEFFHPGSASKNFKYFNPKKLFLRSSFADPGSGAFFTPGSGIRDE
jgi:hypothetical protein